MLAPGSRIGPYEVVAPLGQGGMGEVYRAKDTKLDRQVALKVLPEPFARDAERLARFDREARVLASINHPHIAAIYGREQADGIEALVLELVDGLTLDQVIYGAVDHAPSGSEARQAVGVSGLPLDAALPIARQIALALEAAHARDVLHRDLKPANIKVKDDGTVKVLDFGLAKIVGPDEPGAPGSALGNAATITSPMTQLGVVLGTAAYMAPEQAKGKRVDKRADVWAFGCVLFEMLTGKRAFEGEDVTDTLAAIVRGEPDWSALPVATPPGIRRLLKRCLQKDWSQRLHDIGDARIEIDDAIAGDAENAPAAAIAGDRARRAARDTREVVAWGLAAAATVAAVWLFVTGTGRATENAESVPITFQLAELENSDEFRSPTDLSMSPDGRHVAFAAAAKVGPTRHIWIRSLSSPAARQLAGTDGGTQPIWSPDSRTIAFSARGQLRKIAIDGGLPQTIAESAPSAGGAWNRDNTIVFAGAASLYRVSASGGTPQQITTPAEIEKTGPHRWPAFLPDGRHFVTVANGLAILSSLDATDRTTLFASDSKIVPAPQGYLLFVRGGTLLAQPFDMTRLATSGEAVAIAEGMTTLSFTGNSGGGKSDFDVSAGGALLHRPMREPTRQLVWFDRQGRQLGAVGPVGEYGGVAFSPDATRIAFHIHTSQGGDIFMIDLARNAQSKITNQQGQHSSSAFWIGNDRVGFTALESRRNDLYYARVAPLDGKQVLIAAVTGSAATSDGQVVVYPSVDGLVMRRINGSDAPVTIGRGVYPDLSPDGRWLAFQSGASGSAEVYIQAMQAGATPERVSTAGGIKPRWSPDGSELFYLAQDGGLMSARVRLTGPRPVISAPTLVFKQPVACLNCAHVPYDVQSAQRFLITLDVESARPAPPATVMMGWEQRVRAR